MGGCEVRFRDGCHTYKRNIIKGKCSGIFRERKKLGMQISNCCLCMSLEPHVSGRA